jgi:hypothetical protein
MIARPHQVPSPRRTFRGVAFGPGFRSATPNGQGAVACVITAIPVARDGRDKGRKAVSGE